MTGDQLSITIVACTIIVCIAAVRIVRVWRNNWDTPQHTWTTGTEDEGKP